MYTEVEVKRCDLRRYKCCEALKSISLPGDIESFLVLLETSIILEPFGFCLKMIIGSRVMGELERLGKRYRCTDIENRY